MMPTCLIRGIGWQTPKDLGVRGREGKRGRGAPTFISVSLHKGLKIFIKKILLMDLF